MKIRERNENGELGDYQKIDPMSKTQDEIIEAINNTQVVMEDRTVGMQAIDDFNLQQTFTMDDRTVGMQAIDDFTLQLVNDQAAIIAQLQADVAALKGGV